jgi:HK97 family phage major capsid protein
MAGLSHPVAVKSETEDTITLEGWAVVFGGTDLTGDYFDSSTDFWFKTLGTTKPLLYDHGFNDTLKDSILGTATLEPRDDGVWFTAEIEKSNRYAKQVSALAKASILGASTGAVAHLVKRIEMEDGRNHLKSWPAAELSLTVTPAEPRTLDIKQVKDLVEHAEALKAVLEDEPTEATEVKDDLSSKERDDMSASEFAWVDQNGDGHLPVNDAGHTRAAMARFNQTQFPNSSVRARAWRKILAAAERFGIEVEDRTMPKSIDIDETTEAETSADHDEAKSTEVIDVIESESKAADPVADIQIIEATEPATKGDEAMALDHDTQNALVEGVAAKFAPQFDRISEILARFENEPALKSAGHITVDGGTADKTVKSFADYLMAVKRNDTKRLTDHYAVKAALAEDGGTTGGYGVPTQYVASLLQVAAESSIVRPRAYIQPMTAREIEIPALDQQTAPTAGNTQFFGGVQAVWTGEGAGYTETEPTFKLVRLVAHKLAGYTLASNELQADNAVALESLLLRLFGGAMGWYEDYAFLRGDGVAKPLGIQNAGCSISVTRASSGNDFDPADIGAMMKQLLPTSARKAVWVMHPFLLPSLLALSVGNSGLQTWVTSLREDAPMTLMGMPVIFSEKMATSGSAFDVLLADFSYYVVGDRQSINIASSEHYKFLNGQTTWRFEERIDGQPWLKSAITLSDASSTVSPFVFLT